MVVVSSGGIVVCAPLFLDEFAYPAAFTFGGAGAEVFAAHTVAPAILFAPAALGGDGAFVQVAELIRLQRQRRAALQMVKEQQTQLQVDEVGLIADQTDARVVDELFARPPLMGAYGAGFEHGL